MTATGLKTLWSFFSGGAFAFSAYAFLRSTGQRVKSDDLGIFALSPQALPILALPVELFLIGMTVYITRAWIRDTPSATWYERLPVFFLDASDVRVTMKQGRVYQRWSLALFYMLPMLLAIHMLARFLEAPIFVSGEQIAAHAGQHLGLGPAFSRCGEFLRYADPLGPEYFCWEPWAYIALTCVTAVYWTMTLWIIFRDRGRLAQ